MQQNDDYLDDYIKEILERIGDMALKIKKDKKAYLDQRYKDINELELLRDHMLILIGLKDFKTRG